jgi:hypothetical protein
MTWIGEGGFSVHSVMGLRMQGTRRVFVKGMYTEELDEREGEDAEPQS